MIKRTPGYIVILFIASTFYSCTNSVQKHHVAIDSVNWMAEDSNQEIKTSVQQADSGFSKNLNMGTVSFKVSCTDSGSLNRLTIVPSGIDQKNVIAKEIDGTITDAVIADINGDSFPEIYCFVNSAGSGSYGRIYAYSSNKNKSISPIYLPEITDDKKLSAGYMGHDVFKIDQNRLVRSFPIYKKGDSNALPSGGTRTISYKIKLGEAGWVLEVDNVKDTK